MSKKTGGLAFPALLAEAKGYGQGFFHGQTPNGELQFIETLSGPYLRDLFSLAGMLVYKGENIHKKKGETNAQARARLAYELADAMLEERDKE